MDARPFAALPRRARADLTRAKSAMSARYLRGHVPVRGLARSLRAAPAATLTHNIVGVGVDEKYVHGMPCGISVVKFLVRTKLAPSALTRREKLPAFVDGIPTDVEEVGLIVPQDTRKRSAMKAPPAAETMPNPRARLRPVQPGCSIGFREPGDAFIMAGTFGLLVKDTAGVYLLSNNHVIAYENGVALGGIRRKALDKGAPILQPGLLDQGDTAADQMAQLTRWIDLRADRDNNVADAAIAKPTNKSVVARTILFIGGPGAAAAAAKDMIVHKFGRTTSYTAGRVTSTLFDVTVPYEVGDVMFIDQIAIRGLDGTRFSDSGDSGSAILERPTNKVVGLLFAGATNGTLTFANHIGDVLKKLKVTIA